MTWGLTEWLWLIGIIVAIGLGVAAIIATRRSGNRPRKLLFSWEVVQLVPERSRARGLVVSYNDEEVKDPRLVQVVLKNVGPLDISSGDFDANDNLEVHVESSTMGITPYRAEGDIIDILDMRTLDVDGSDTAVEMFSAGPGYVDVAPRLLRRGASITIDFLVDGPVEVYLKSPLINTDIVSPSGAKRFSSGFRGVLASVSIGALGVPGLYVQLNKAESR